MAKTEIRETTVSPDGDGSIVRLQISDAPPPYESATMHLQLTVRLPAYEPPLLAHLQREAIDAAVQELRVHLQGLYQEIQRNPHNDPRPMARRS